MSSSLRRRIKLKLAWKLIYPFIAALLFLYVILWLYFLPFPHWLIPALPDGIWLWMMVMAWVMRTPKEMLFYLAVLVLVDGLLHQPLFWHDLWLSILVPLMLYLKKKQQQWRFPQISFVAGVSIFILYALAHNYELQDYNILSVAPLLTTFILWLTWVYRRFAKNYLFDK